MSIVTIAAWCYAAVFALCLIAELSRRRRVGLRSAFSALFLSVVGGTLACAVAIGLPYDRGFFSDPPRKTKVSDRSSAKGGQPMKRGDGRWAGGTSKSNSGFFVGSPRPDDDFEIEDGIGRANGREAGEAAASVKAAVRQAWQAAPVRTLEPGDTIKDCDICPEMIVIGPGTAEIGASESDDQATGAERPIRHVRYWPGFALSRTAISLDLIRRFRDAVKIAPAACPGNGPALSGEGMCISPVEADAFAKWLSQQSSGLGYRLVSANEWEYAARTMGTAKVAALEGQSVPRLPFAGLGQLQAEFTADCWLGYNPPLADIRLSHVTDTGDCKLRVLKGAAIDEDRRHARVSARRPADAREPRLGAGFRVMRELR